MMNLFENTGNEATEKGMTLEQLRYRRSLVYLKCEMIKEQVKMQYADTISSVSNVSTGLFGKLSTGIDYLQYAISGYRMFKKISKIFRSDSRNSD